MADTLRALSALQTLLATNGNRGVSAQDLRDFLVSAVGYMLVTTVTTTTVLDADDIVILANATSGAITLTLPAAASSTNKFYIAFKTDSGGNAVTIDGNASEEINGATTLALAAQFDCAALWCNGTAWYALIGA